MPLTKITVMIHEGMLQQFNRQVESLHLKRDAFLDSMIQQELPYLEAEMSDKCLSSSARRYIAGELKKRGTRKVNLQIQQSTADALNRIVERANMVRDAFINRLILFLRSNSLVLKILDLPECHTNGEYSEWLDPLPISPLRAMEAVQVDPFFYLRFHIEKQYGMGLYLVDLPPQLYGFACYLPDSLVPGTAAYKASENDLDDLLSDILPKEKSEITQTPKDKG